MRKINILVAIITLFAFLNNAQAYQQPVYQGQASYIAPGTPVGVSLEQALGSAFSRVGDRFTASLSTPIYAGSQLVAAPGSKVEGTVIEVTPAGRAGKPGSIDLRITNVITPNGQRIPLSATIDKTTFKLEADGGRVSNYAKATAAGAAGGALSGLIGGAISGGKFGKSTAIGTGIGAGVGILGGTIKKGRELVLQQGTALPFKVDAGSQLAPMQAPTQVRQYGSDYGASGYTPQAPSGTFADPYAGNAPTQTQAPVNYQQQQPYNPYLD